MGEGGGLALAKFLAEYHGLWTRDAPRISSPIPGNASGNPGILGPNLTHLNLQQCNIGSKGASAILESLSLGIPLVSLDLTRNGIDHQVRCAKCDAQHARGNVQHAVGIWAFAISKCVSEVPGAL